MKRTIIVFVLIAIILGVLILPVIAEQPKKIPAEHVAQIKRGAKNVTLGWTAIPDSIVTVTKETKNPLLGITVGLVKGTLNAFARTVSGAVDIVSSPVSGNSSAPMVKTEMVQVSQGTK